MFDKKVGALLKNEASGRFHPIIFTYRPMPGPEKIGQKHFRFRSFGHHTAGFDTREEAVKHITEEIPAKDTSAKYITKIDVDIPWSGEAGDMPVAACFVTTVGGKEEVVFL